MFFKKKNEGAPDVGKEDDGERVKKKKDEDFEEDSEEEEEAVEKIKKKKGSRGEFVVPEIEKLSARLDSINELLKGHSERFSHFSEQIGEIRTMSMNNEKMIVKASEEGARAADIVKEVKPEKLRLDYQKLELRISAVDERIESHKQYMETILDEIKDIKKREGVSLGTEGILRLSKEVKQDLMDIQKINARTKLNADKAESIFVELKERFGEYEKIRDVIGDISVSNSEIKKEIDSLRLNRANLVKKDELSNFEKTISNKLKLLEGEYSKIDLIQNEVEKMDGLIESSLAISQDNKEEIADIAFTIGKDDVKRVSDFEDDFAGILKIIEELSEEIDDLKKRIGTKSKQSKSLVDFKKRVSRKKERKKIISGKK